ncbi:MAG TPA: hypothetical protein VJS45_17160 [Acidimicrobiia bacterium]|nr:hypothetical protein [Acidimicrobiia bacterium]
MTWLDPRIPERYRKLWVPAGTVGELVHHTTTAHLAEIERAGFIEPRDPSPKHWGGLVAIFMADASDPLYGRALADVLAHVREKDDALVRLSLQTENVLFRSVDLKRTFQIISLDPIAFGDIAQVELID